LLLYSVTGTIADTVTPTNAVTTRVIVRETASSQSNQVGAASSSRFSSSHANAHLERVGVDRPAGSLEGTVQIPKLIGPGK
jgi:hypothetical protein